MFDNSRELKKNILKSSVKQKGKCPKLSIKNSEKKSLKNKRYIIPFRTTAWKSQKRMIKKGSALF